MSTTKQLTKRDVEQLVNMHDPVVIRYEGHELGVTRVFHGPNDSELRCMVDVGECSEYTVLPLHRCRIRKGTVS